MSFPSGWVWWRHGDYVAIASFDGLDAFTATDEDGAQILLHCSAVPSRFTTNAGSMDEEPAIPEQFHMAIVQGAIALGYELRESADVQRAAYFRALYEQAVRKAKKCVGDDMTDGATINIAESMF